MEFGTIVFMDLTWLELLPLARELGKRFVKMGRTAFGYKIKLRPGYDLVFLPGKIYTTRAILPSNQPDTFVKMVNNVLANKLVGISVLNYDRILTFSTDEYTLVCEIFSGDFFLLNKDGVIVASKRVEEKGARDLHTGAKYVPPPRGPLTPETKDFSFLLGKQLVPGLVKGGLPPKYAEEIARRLGVEPRVTVDETLLGDLEKELQCLWGYVENPEPRIYVAEGYDIAILPLTIHAQEIIFSKVSDALDFLFTKEVLEADSSENKNKKIKYMEKALQEMEIELHELELMVQEFYNHFTEFQNAYNLAKLRKRPPEVIGPFTLEKFEGGKVVYRFTPRERALRQQ